MAVKKNISWLNRIVLFLNILALLPLLGAYLAPYISPLNNWHIAFLGLTFPIWLIIHFLFILFWLIRLHRYFLISFIALLIGYSHISQNFQLFQYVHIDEDSSAFKVMSYNVKNFDLYNYTPDWKIQQDNRIHIMDFFNQEQPDILCLQEFVNIDGKVFPTVDTITKLLPKINNHIYYTSHTKTTHFGIATFTKFPIINRGEINFLNVDGNNTCIFTDVVIKQDTVRIYNIHLQSIHFENPDYQFAKEITEGNINNDTLTITSKSKKIMRSLKKAFIKRAKQADIIGEHILNTPYPIIICGDFNDTPSSYSYYQISKHMNDAFKVCGKGIGETYNGIFPLLRIDYIFYSLGMQSYKYKKYNVGYSDHHPISCMLYMKKY